MRSVVKPLRHSVVESIRVFDLLEHLIVHSLSYSLYHVGFVTGTNFS